MTTRTITRTLGAIGALALTGTGLSLVVRFVSSSGV